jgi:tetratricopeptide (TPR) repeat protein
MLNDVKHDLMKGHKTLRISRMRFPGVCGAALVACIGLAGCSTMPQEPAVAAPVEESVVEEEVAAPAPPKRPHPDEYPVANFEDDALYKLLVAEVAVFRGQLDTALDEYVAVTESSRDPGVAARTTSLAAYLRKNSAALAAAQIWASEDPDNLNAHRTAADLLMRVGDLEAAIVHLEEVKRLGGLANFGRFAFQAANLNEESRTALLEGVSRMLQDYPDDEQLKFSKAVLLEQNGDLEEALLIADELLVDKRNINVVILKVNALKNLEREAEAIGFLQQMLAELPENRRLRLIFARFLFESEDLDGARAQYEIILQKSPNDGDVLFALALIAMERKDDESAKEYLNDMVRWDKRTGEAHFYLGSIAERNNDVFKAIREYKQAGNGYEFLPAHSRIASILVDQGRVDEARDHLERMRSETPARRQQLIMVEAQLLSERGFQDHVFDLLDTQLENEPENVDLLYFRAMTGQRFDRLDILERDLKAIITINPDNADALNALGYTLADQTDRHEEALTLIEKALAIKPDEAAFIDSLGWVNYRLKNFEAAVTHLRRALSLFPNDEVAAHLGEVLWVMGEHLEASEVWDKALELAPDSEILKKVIQQFTNR